MRMASLLKIVSLLFSVALIRSDQNIDSLKSFKLSGNVTYDCIDIYKQPSLNHHLLINHKIQMKPSIPISRFEITNQTTNHKTYKNKIHCPDGTVPIMRSTKEYISNARRFEEMHFNPLATDSFTNTYVSGVKATTGHPYHGVQARFNIFELNISNDQASYASIFLGTETDYIQVGWMINPSMFGDQRVWSYGFWRGKNGEGCYNMNCPGFIQIYKEVPLSSPNDPTPWVDWYHFFIHQDMRTGNWWITLLRKNKPDLYIGYWPKELFDNLNNGAQMVGVGGFAQASPSGSSPPMGSGYWPSQRPYNSAMFQHVEVLNKNYDKQRIDHSHVDVLLDGTKCYGIKNAEFAHTSLGFYFNYGGPGGNAC